MSEIKESGDVVFIQNLIRFLRRRRKVLTALLPAGILAVLLLQGLYTVPVNERGALYQFGKMGNDSVAPGIHFKLPQPIHSLRVMNIDEIRSFKLIKEIRGPVSMLTGDENFIRIGVALQYRITGYGDFLRGAENWETVLNMAASSCLTDLIAGMKVDEVLTTGKSVIQAELMQKTQKLLNRYNSGISLFSVTIENIKPPTECQDSFRMVANARNERAEKINIAQSERSRRLSTARGEAVSIILAAESESEEIIKSTQAETQRYEAVLEEYRKAPAYTVDEFYLKSMRNIIDRTEILLISAEDAGKINLNHFLQQEQQAVAGSDQNPGSAPVTEVQAGAEKPRTAVENAARIQRNVQEVRRVPPAPRR